jgi:hypothetical protein
MVLAILVMPLVAAARLWYQETAEGFRLLFEILSSHD